MDEIIQETPVVAEPTLVDVPLTSIEPINESAQDTQAVETEKAGTEEKHSILTEIEEFIKDKIAALRAKL